MVGVSLLAPDRVPARIPSPRFKRAILRESSEEEVREFHARLRHILKRGRLSQTYRAA